MPLASPNSVFICWNCKGIKYLRRLHLGLNHLHEHKFKHSFQDTLNTFCSCGLDVQTSTHFFLYWLLLNNQRCTLLGTVNYIDSSLTNTDIWNSHFIKHHTILGNTSRLYNLKYQKFINFQYFEWIQSWISIEFYWKQKPPRGYIWKCQISK